MIPVAMVPVALTVGFILGALWFVPAWRRRIKGAEMDTPNCWFCGREYEEYVPDTDLFEVCPDCLWDGSEANPRNRPEIIKGAEGSRTLGETET